MNLADYCTQRHAQPGANTTLTSNPLGMGLGASPSSRVRHPWLTTPMWSPVLAQWTATVDPGFLNDQTPIFTATVTVQQKTGSPWENNPLTGQPFFSASVFNQPQDPAQTITVDVPLYLTPIIPLDVREIGYDGDPTYIVPAFFINLGAAQAPPTPSADDIEAGADLSLPPPPPGLRLLRACDIWLHQPRVALTSTITTSDGIDGQSNVTQTLGVALPAPSDTLKVLEGTFVPETQAIDPTQSDYTEPNFDEIVISTVYLLSPPNTPAYSVPDGTWTPYVQHSLFWNLAWAQPTLNYQPPPTDAGLSSLSFLGDGAGGTVINYLSSSLNDALQATQNALAANSLAGTFWTPTGAGLNSTATQNSTTPAPALGPDIYKNLAATVAAARAAQLATQLDPPFPYTPLPFSMSLAAAGT